jgi:hypothetical protein
MEERSRLIPLCVQVLFPGLFFLPFSPILLASFFFVFLGVLGALVVNLLSVTAHD